MIKGSKKWKLVFVSALMLSITCISGGMIAGADEQREDDSPASLWQGGKYTTITSNVDVPSYASEGYIGKGETDYVTKSDLPAWRTNGVLVQSKSDGEEVVFKNMLDVNTLTTSSLIDVMPLTSGRFQTSDFKVLTVKLTDADDETNWFAIHLSTYNYIDAWEQKVYTHLYLSSSKYNLKPNYGDWRFPIELNGFYGMNQFIDWAAMSERDAALVAQGKNPLGESEYIYYHDLKDSLLLPYTLYFDPTTYEVSVGNSYGTKVVCYDLDNTELVGIGNEFTGFASGRVKLSVSASKFNKGEAQYMILNVAGYGMNGETMTDNGKPSYIENLPLHNGELPVAIVGKNYDLFDVNFYDFVDGDVKPVIFVTAPNGVSSILSQASFTPTIAGTYHVKYSATDAAGNERILNYYVTAKNESDVEPLQITVDGAAGSRRLVGEEIAIPSYSVQGGSGNLTTKISVIRLSENKEIAHENGKFIPLFAGEYQIKYTVTDYVGSTLSHSIWCSVKNENTPILTNEIKMYERVIAGGLVQLPTANAFDYSSIPGQKRNAVTEITVTGTGDKSNVSERVQNYQFMPDVNKFGENIRITYKMYCEKYPQNAITRTYDVQIYTPRYAYDLFNHSEQIEASVNAQEDENSFVKLKAAVKGDLTATFVNPIKANYFEMKFGVLASESNLSAINVRLIDSVNTNVYKDFTFSRKNDSSISVAYEGNTYVMLGVWGSDSFLSFSYANGKFFDGLGTCLFTLDGFQGFASGKVWVEITLVGAQKDSAVCISKLGAQSLAGRYRKNSEGVYQLVQLTDTLNPTIDLTESVVSDAKHFEVVRIPYAVGYDVITTGMNVTYKVVAPNGSTLCDWSPVGLNKTFAADEYGVYTLLYQTTDGAGNTCEMQFSISVFDLDAPTLHYKGESVLHVKAGRTCTFAEATAYDAVDATPTVIVILINDDLLYTDVTKSMSYTFTEKGEYTLRYYAYDDNYNNAYLDVTIIVE